MDKNILFTDDRLKKYIYIDWIELIQKWKDTFKGIDGNILLKFGIPLNDKTNNMYYNWIPCKDEDKYGIIVSSQILNSLTKDDGQQYYLCP